jgi:hypothetical protein
VAEAAEQLQERLLIHALAEVGADGVEEVDPMKVEMQELDGVVDAEEPGPVEPFVVGSVASFDTAIVAFVTQLTAAQITS